MSARRSSMVASILRQCVSTAALGALLASALNFTAALKKPLPKLRIGSAEFAVTQPRLPCFKLGIRFGDPRMVKMFMKSGRTGFYLAVTREGEVEADNPVEIVRLAENGFSVSDIARMYSEGAKDQEELRRTAELPALPESWRDYFRKQIEDAEG